MMCVSVSVYACVRLFDVCVSIAFRVMLNGMTKVATPLLASSSSLGHPISAARVFNSKYLFSYVLAHLPVFDTDCAHMLAT